jgi:TatD DNase family protein
MFIDTHCHLNFKAFHKDLDAVLNRAKDAGVGKIIIPGAKLDSSMKAVEIAQKYDNCYAAIGIHPHHANDYIRNGAEFIQKELNRISQNNKVVAIGEIGLDEYQYKNIPPVSDQLKKAQKDLLLLQLLFASNRNLPVIIHCRNAQEKLLLFMKEFVKSHSLTGVFHCFDGDASYLRHVLDLGFYIGFDGNITYPENERLRLLVRMTPPNRLLLETDSPFLTPIPHRKTRNEPAYIQYTFQCVSDVTQKSVEEIEKMTDKNATSLFRI